MNEKAIGDRGGRGDNPEVFQHDSSRFALFYKGRDNEDSEPYSDERITSSSPSEVDDVPEKDLEQLEPTTSSKSIAETLSPFREFMFIAVICLTQLLTQAGLGQTLSIIHIIADSFGMTNPGEIAWLIAGYSLTIGTFILISGRFGDLYGHKNVLLLGFGWYALWTMVAGLAVFSNKVLFIFARVLSGIGPSLCLPNALAIFGLAYSDGPKKRLAFALFGAVAPGGSILGSAMAALFAQLAWWPWAFWSLSITLAGTAVLGAIVIPAEPRPKQGRTRTLREFVVDVDLIGGTVGVTALILVNFGWNQAATVGWSEVYVYVLLIIGLLLVPLFFYFEFRISEKPLIPPETLNSDVGFALGCVSCGWGSFGIWLYYYWEFAEQLRGATPLLASAWLAPNVIVGALAALTTAYLLGKIRPAWVMMIAMTCFAVGITLMATSPVGQTYWTQTFIHTLIIPFGMDMSFPSGTLLLSNAVPAKHQGVAMSLVNTVVNYSISLSLGISGTIGPHVTGGDQSRAGLLREYRAAWYFAIGLAVLGMCLSATFVLKPYVKKAKGNDKPKS